MPETTTTATACPFQVGDIIEVVPERCLINSTSTTFFRGDYAIVTRIQSSGTLHVNWQQGEVLGTSGTDNEWHISPCNFKYLRIKAPIKLPLKGKENTKSVWLDHVDKRAFLRLPHAASGMEVATGFIQFIPKGQTNKRIEIEGEKSSSARLLRELFVSHLRFIFQELQGAKFPSEIDPETGYSSKPPDAIRAPLPAHKCAFCKNETTRTCKCETCGFQSFATCEKCLELGAPDIRAPRRMSKVFTSTAPKNMCYPHCTRKLAYKCRQCQKWHDKTLLHKMIRQERNITVSLCEKCSKKDNITVCSSCHGIAQIGQHNKVVTGFLCLNCLARGYRFREKIVKRSLFKIIKACKNAQRTFGIELEINHIHKAEWLSKLIHKLNINGVRFNVKMDGSVHDGFEVTTSPADMTLALRATKNLFPILRKFKHDYTGCGLHVHIQDKNINPVSLFKTWAALEPYTMNLILQHRRGGEESSYCRPITWKAGHFQKILTLKTEEECREWQEERYRALNLFALDKYGTIEVRNHHATTNYTEALYWLKYLNALWELARKKPDNELLTTINNLSMPMINNERETDIHKILKLSPLTSKALHNKRMAYLKLPVCRSKEQKGCPGFFDSSMRSNQRQLLRLLHGMRVPRATAHSIAQAARDNAGEMETHSGIQVRQQRVDYATFSADISHLRDFAGIPALLNDQTGEE